MLVADYRFFEKMGQSSLSKTSSYLVCTLSNTLSTVIIGTFGMNDIESM